MNLYRQIDVWERPADYVLIRYVCFENIVTKKFFVQHSTVYKPENYPNLQNDPKFVKHVEWDKYLALDGLLSMSPEERLACEEDSPQAGYDSLEEAILEWVKNYGL